MPLPTHVLNEIARLMRDPDALRHERGRVPSSAHRGHYDPNQPRAAAGNPNGGQWIDVDNDDPAGRTDNERSQLAQFSPYAPIRPGHPLVALLSLFAALSAKNTPDRRTVFEFNAREYLRDPESRLSRPEVSVLTREEVENACRKLEDVQRRTDQASHDVNMNIKRTGQPMSRSQSGTAIHMHLKRQIDSLMDPNYRAEVSFWKDDEDRYGRRDGIRVDVNENAGRRLACVYDIKTGQSRGSGLSPRRMAEIAEHVLRVYPHVQRIIVTEVRPTR